MVFSSLDAEIQARVQQAARAHVVWPTQPHHDDYVAAVTTGYSLGVYDHTQYMSALTWAGDTLRNGHVNQRAA